MPGQLYYCHSNKPLNSIIYASHCIAGFGQRGCYNTNRKLACSICWIILVRSAELKGGFHLMRPFCLRRINKLLQLIVRLGTHLRSAYTMGCPRSQLPLSVARLTRSLLSICSRASRRKTNRAQEMEIGRSSSRTSARFIRTAPFSKRSHAAPRRFSHPNWATTSLSVTLTVGTHDPKHSRTYNSAAGSCGQVG